MSVTITLEVVETGMWPQRDARDPLGIWGARAVSTGDATGGITIANVNVLAALRRAHVYSLYGAVSEDTGGVAVGSEMSLRILTGWPNIDSTALGIGFYGQTTIVALDALSLLNNAPIGQLVSDIDKFKLIFDPHSAASGDLRILAMVRNDNVDGETVRWEVYGYFWDRAILNTPGGPRWPGSF